MPLKALHSQRGAALIELPAFLFFIFIVISFPLIGMVTLAYRDSLFWWAINHACSEASKAPSFYSAQVTAQARLTGSCGAFSGIKIKHCKVSIICKSLSNGLETEWLTSLDPATIDAHKNLYFLRVAADGLIDPIVERSGGALSSMAIPGFTAPYPLGGTCQLFFERPKGLST